MEDGKRKPKNKPYEEEPDFDWRQYKHQLKKEEDDDFEFAETYTNIKDIDSEDHYLDITEGEVENEQTQGKQEQAEGRKDSEGSETSKDS